MLGTTDHPKGLRHSRMILNCKGFYADEPKPSRSMVARLIGWYHGLFHLAQATIHDRWVKRLRLIAFVAASSIATQIVLRSALGEVGLGSILPSSVLTILVASAIWLVAYPAMWLRMMTVVVEMEAKKEYALILSEIHKLHHHHDAEASTEERPFTPGHGDTTRR